MVMRSNRPIPRSPRNIAPSVVVKGPSNWPIWLVRTLWSVLGATLTVVVTFLSQGPDAIRRLPEIPKAAMETVEKAIEETRITRALTATWIAGPLQSAGLKGNFGLKLDMTCSKKECDAAFTSPAMKTWSPGFGIVNFQGLREGKFVTGKVFDWINNERIDIAEIRIQFQADDSGGIRERAAPLVEDVLQVTVVSQIAPVLPLTFELIPK